MIESIVNGIQLLTAAVCAVFSAFRLRRTRSRVWGILTLFYGVFTLGDLYWGLYLVLYGKTPQIFYVSDFSWYAAYLFLFMLLRCVMPPEEQRARYPLAWAGPVFAAGMCAFYMTRGDYPGNLITLVLMSLLLYNVLRGLLFLRRQENAPRRLLYLVTLAFCLIEYGSWTASCFWMGDTLGNPYFWFDLLLTAILVCFIPAGRRLEA